MKKILRHSFHITRWTLASLIIAVTLLLLFARGFSSYIEDYATDIVARLSIVLGVPVEVDSVSTEWHGLGPSVYLEGLRLGEGESVSSFSSVIVKPDVVSSLLSWSIIWSRFEVTEMDAYLKELPSGRWAFAGIELGGDGGGGAYLEKMILESNLVSVQQARLTIRSLLGTEIELNVHDMNLVYALAFHRLKLDADFGTEDNRFEFIAELTGTSPRLLELNGLAYMKIDAHNIGDLYERISDEFLPGITLDTDDIPKGEIELWANLRKGKQIEWQGTAVLDNIPARFFGYGSGEPRFIADLTGVYSAQSQSLNLQDAEIQLFSDTVELPDIQINRRPGVSEVGYNLALPEFQITELLSTLSKLPVIADSGLQRISELKPEGEFDHLYLQIPNLDFKRWTLSGRLNSVNIDSFRNAPAVKNLSGYFSLDQHHGSIGLESSDVSILYPGVYDYWLEHEQIEGTVSWQIDFESHSLFVFADELSVLGEHGPVKGGFLADIPLEPGRETGVDLTLFIGIEETSAEQKDNLIPSSLPQDLRDWLDKSILAGDVPEAGFIYRGSTKSGQSAHRTTQLRLNIKEAELAYLEQWPNAQSLDAELWVSNGFVNSLASSGRLLDLELSDISVELKPITEEGKKTNLLSLQSSALGASTSLLGLVRTTSLREQVGDGLDGLDIGGNSEISLSLQLPIRKDLERSDIDVHVQVNLLSNRLLLVEQNLQIDDIRGTLNYGHQGLEGSGIRARLWDRPIELDLQEDNSIGKLAIDVQGAVDVSDAIEWLDLDFLGRIEGITSVIGRIELASRPGMADYYHFWTDMRGVSSGFPEPFTKQADKVAPLDIKVVSDGLIVTSLSWDILEGTNTAIQSEPGEFLFELAQDPDSISSKSIQYARLAFQSPMPEVQEGLFTGEIRLADVNVDECIDVYKSEVEALSADNQSSSYGTIMGLKPDLSIITERFLFAGTDFGKVMANLGFEPGAWKLNLEADYAAGSLLAFKDRQTPLLNVVSMDLNQVQTLLIKEGSDQGLLDPRSLPALEFDIASMTLDSIERGAWQGTLTPTEDGVLINDLQGGFRSARLSEQQSSSTVFWGLDTEGYYTELGLTFEYGDIGDLFRLADIEPPMSSDSGVFYTSLNWQGAPYEFSSSNPQGLMGIDARNGSFFTNDNKVPNGLLKMIGLINVGSWVRRLRLDFNDMTASGTPYDLVVGDFVVDGDMITTLTPVDIELSSGSMLFDGAINLAEEKVDAKLVVTLPARQNVTWVAALVAGLPAAAGVWLAGIIFDDELDNLSSVSYKVQGSLDDPKVSAEKMFESTITQ